MTRNLKRSKWLGRLRRYGPLVFWIGVIFYFSSSFGSFDQTSLFIRPLLEFLFPAADPELLVTYHGYIRKFAHFAEYAILALVAMRALRDKRFQALRRYTYLISLSIVIIVAILDEFNQSQLPTRTGSVYDILLDISGGLIASCFLYLMKFMGGERSKPDASNS